MNEAASLCIERGLNQFAARYNFDHFLILFSLHLCAHEWSNTVEQISVLSSWSTFYFLWGKITYITELSKLITIIII